MSELKPQEFERLLRSSSALPRIIVIFGPDRGLVSERAEAAAARTGIPLSDPFAVTKIEASDLQKAPGRLIEEMQSIGLFGGEKLVWVRNAANEKALVDGIAALAATELEAYLIIEAGDLKKGSALRKAAEAARSIASVPCYADDQASLNGLIDDILKETGQRITPAARARLLANLGGDRRASRGEIRKLALYCAKEPEIDERHVIDIIGDVSETSLDNLIDALLGGDANAMIAALEALISAKTAIYQVLNAVLRQFQMLDMLRAEMDRSRQSASQVIQTHGKHIFFKRRNVITQALSVWTAAKLTRELSRLQTMVLTSQRNPQIAESVAAQLLLSLTQQSVIRK
ncbi:DNA polymerase-3 subunit delta [Rhizobium aquaticum]|uniref:DNA-directed DNA polymerase n=1 Tax=Rhizobium aquaticum TaxID=1549636 RepID=A0ABV2J437_9HYPH